VLSFKRWGLTVGTLDGCAPCGRRGSLGSPLVVADLFPH
jgi:hypothetical protein